MVLSMWGVFCSCSTEYRRQEPSQTNNKSNICKILYYASLAGSSHNSQPWKVVVTGDRMIRLYADTTRELPVVDPDGRELYISLGAFIENLTLAAGSLGYETTVMIAEDFRNNRPVAEIDLHKASSVQFDLKLIERRMTLRIPFQQNPIRATDVNQLVTPDPQQIRYYSATSEEGSFIAEKALEAYSQQAYNREAQAELATWMRFSDKDVKDKKDGLTTAGMQLTGIAGFMVRNFYKPEDSKKTSFVKAGIAKTKKQVQGCGGWVLMTAATHSVKDWVNLGRRYQQIHLTCTKLHIGFQPMNQIVEEAKFKKGVSKHLGIKEELMFIARIGYIDRNPVPVSPRRPVEDFTTFIH